MTRRSDSGSWVSDKRAVTSGSPAGIGVRGWVGRFVVVFNIWRLVREFRQPDSLLLNDHYDSIAFQRQSCRKTPVAPRIGALFSRPPRGCGCLSLMHGPTRRNICPPLLLSP